MIILHMDREGHLPQLSSLAYTIVQCQPCPRQLMHSSQKCLCRLEHWYVFPAQVEAAADGIKPFVHCGPAKHKQTVEPGLRPVLAHCSLRWHICRGKPCAAVSLVLPILETTLKTGWAPSGRGKVHGDVPLGSGRRGLSHQVFQPDP